MSLKEETGLRAAAPLSPGCPTTSTSPLSGRSDELVTSPLPAREAIRSGYLRLGPSYSPPPLLSASPFVPASLIAHLMRNKKESALGVKWLDDGDDAVTNIEGAVHTFLTPVVPINMHGDYIYRDYRHWVGAFPDKDGRAQARRVVLSALVQPDFEDDQVMYQLAALGDAPFQGIELPSDFVVPSRDVKQDPAFREAYDDALRAHLVKHLTIKGSLPAKRDVLAMSNKEAVAYLSQGGSPLGAHVRAVRGEAILSLELLFLAAVEQVANEFSALQALCPNGYVYTFDPPAIFAACAGATLLNRLFIAAIKHLAELNPKGFPAMRIFAFNDYADPDTVSLFQTALESQPHILVTRKAALFPNGLYTPPREGAGALLVIHNNSDAFGQNIETETDGGSLDGAIGNHSSAAASLQRQHPRLLDLILDQSVRLRTR